MIELDAGPENEPSINSLHFSGSSGPGPRRSNGFMQHRIQHGANKLISIMPKRCTRDINDIFLPSTEQPPDFSALSPLEVALRRCVVPACAMSRNHKHCERDPRRRRWRRTVSVASNTNTWLTDTQKIKVDK